MRHNQRMCSTSRPDRSIFKSSMTTPYRHVVVAVGQRRHGSRVVGVAVEIGLPLEPGPFGERSGTDVVRVDEQRRSAALPGDREVV